MSQDPVVFSFGDASVAQGNQFAGSLADTLRDVDPDIQIERIRQRPDSQDFGASLAIILGTVSAGALAKGIASWLARNSGAKIEIRRDGLLVMSANQLDSRDVPKLVEALHAAGLTNG